MYPSLPERSKGQLTYNDGAIDAVLAVGALVLDIIGEAGHHRQFASDALIE